MTALKKGPSSQSTEKTNRAIIQLYDDVASPPPHRATSRVWGRADGPEVSLDGIGIPRAPDPTKPRAASAVPSETVVDLILDQSRPLRPDSWELWSAWLDGVLLVYRVRDPEHAACRALVAKGITGRVTFRHMKSGTRSLSMDIVRGAGATTRQTASGRWRIERWEPRENAAVASPKPFPKPPATRLSAEVNASPAHVCKAMGNDND